MAKPELGTKRLCSGCGVKFYDLGKAEIQCPKCETPFIPVAVAEKAKPVKAPEPAKPEVKPEAEAAPVAEVELVSLEEADAEVEDQDLAAIKDVDDLADIEDDDETIDKDAEDNTFLETDEDDPNVSDLIGTGVTKNEE